MSSESDLCMSCWWLEGRGGLVCALRCTAIKYAIDRPLIIALTCQVWGSQYTLVIEFVLFLELHRIFREQKRVAKAIISSQEEAFWRLHRPPVPHTPHT